ncbi:MAG: hypothetical protein PF450_14775 [Bacteroidales bacterium]|jgi:hypothetical protein|nr:hypothetical protein [Bacteroidales bacterium]
MNFKEENITYQQMGELIMEVLRIEGEELEFLSDYIDYCCLTYDKEPESVGDLVQLEMGIKETPEFKLLLRVFHSLVMECTRGEYQTSRTISEFLGEGFYRFHNSLAKK